MSVKRHLMVEHYDPLPFGPPPVKRTKRGKHGWETDAVEFLTRYAAGMDWPPFRELAQVITPNVLLGDGTNQHRGVTPNQLAVNAAGVYVLEDTPRSRELARLVLHRQVEHGLGRQEVLATYWDLHLGATLAIYYTARDRGHAQERDIARRLLRQSFGLLWLLSIMIDGALRSVGPGVRQHKPGWHAGTASSCAWLLSLPMEMGGKALELWDGRNRQRCTLQPFLSGEVIASELFSSEEIAAARAWVVDRTMSQILLDLLSGARTFFPLDIAGGERGCVLAVLRDARGQNVNAASLIARGVYSHAVPEVMSDPSNRAWESDGMVAVDADSPPTSVDVHMVGAVEDGGPRIDQRVGFRATSDVAWSVRLSRVIGSSRLGEITRSWDGDPLPRWSDAASEGGASGSTDDGGPGVDSDTNPDVRLAAEALAKASAFLAEGKHPRALAWARTALARLEAMV